MAGGSISAQLNQPAFLFLAEQAPNGRFDSFSLGAFVQGVLAAGTAAQVDRLLLQRARKGVVKREGAKASDGAAPDREQHSSTWSNEQGNPDASRSPLPPAGAVNRLCVSTPYTPCCTHRCCVVTSGLGEQQPGRQLAPGTAERGERGDAGQGHT